MSLSLGLLGIREAFQIEDTEDGPMPTMLGLAASLERRLVLCLNFRTNVSLAQLSEYNGQQFMANS